MSGLARRLAFPCGRHGLVRLPPALPATNALLRLVSTDSGLDAARRAVRATGTDRAASAPPAATLAPSRYAVLKQLVTKPTPTTLYEAPSHFWLYFGCWSAGLSLIAWTVLTASTVVNQPDGVPRWVCAVYGVSYVFLNSMGFYLIGKTANIVASIRMLPAAAGTGAVPRLEVRLKRMVPLLTPKTVSASLDKVALKSRFSMPEEHLSEMKRFELMRRYARRREAQRRHDMSHLLTLPLRRLLRGLAGLFYGTKSAWTDSGLRIIRVDGRQYRVDVTGGFAHDGFRTLERLVKIGWD